MAITPTASGHFDFRRDVVVVVAVAVVVAIAVVAVAVGCCGRSLRVR